MAKNENTIVADEMSADHHVSSADRGSKAWITAHFRAIITLLFVSLMLLSIMNVLVFSRPGMQFCSSAGCIP